MAGRSTATTIYLIALLEIIKARKKPARATVPARRHDGDGRMDKHIFADFEHGVPGGPERVTSLDFHIDGVIVAQAPDILWGRDTNGDGVADKVEVLYTGFGTGDTHAVINNFRWGMDGWVYSAIGYSAGNPGSGDGAKDFGRVTAGVIRFKPDGSALEQVASGSCNTWGFDFSPDGEAFYTTATCGNTSFTSSCLKGIGAGQRGACLPPFFRTFRYSTALHQIVGLECLASAGCCIYNGGAA